MSSTRAFHVRRVMRRALGFCHVASLQLLRRSIGRNFWTDLIGLEVLVFFLSAWRSSSRFVIHRGFSTGRVFHNPAKFDDDVFHRVIHRNGFSTGLSTDFSSATHSEKGGAGVVRPPRRPLSTGPSPLVHRLGITCGYVLGIKGCG